MKKQFRGFLIYIICVILVLFSVISVVEAGQQATGTTWTSAEIVPGPYQTGKFPAIGAGGAVLLEGATGDILYGKNPYVPRPPASTTKILTVGLAVERGNLDRLIKVSYIAGHTGESSIHLDPGEIISVRELVYGAMIKSGNDACVALAEDLGGDESGFAVRMTLKTRFMGGTNSNFCNSNGLPAKGHVTSPYELAQITRWALTNRDFAGVVRSREKIIPWRGKSWSRYLKNTNKLLWNYSLADGVKTGTTNEAGECLVASATKDGRQLVAVLLNSPARFQEAQALLEYGFSNYQFVSILNKGQDEGTVIVRDGQKKSLTLIAREDLKAVIPAGVEYKKVINCKTFVKAPVPKGTVLGSAAIIVNNRIIKRVALVTKGPEKELGLWGKVTRKLENW